MIRRRSTRLPFWIVGSVGSVGSTYGIVCGVLSGLSSPSGVGSVYGLVSSIIVYVVSFLSLLHARGRGHSVRGRRTRSSGLPGGVGWLRVSFGGTMRRLLHACTSVDRLVDYLLDRTVEKLPAAVSARFAEEWQDHRTHYSGWRLVWWALCVRATALRTVAALGPARLPRDS